MSKINFFWTYDDFRCGLLRSIHHDLTFFVQYTDGFDGFEHGKINSSHGFTFRSLLSRPNTLVEVVSTDSGFLPLSDAHVYPDFEYLGSWIIHMPTCFGYRCVSGDVSNTGPYHTVLRLRPYSDNPKF